MTIVLENFAFESTCFISAGIIMEDRRNPAQIARDSAEGKEPHLTPAIQIFLAIGTGISVSIGDHQTGNKPPVQRYTIRGETPQDTFNLYISLLEQRRAPLSRIPSLEKLQKMYQT
jgi:hypothetical protein